MKKSVTLYCFTPLVTLITFIIEVVIGIGVLIRYRHSLFGRVAALLIFFLSFFQISEYMVCGTNEFYPWSMAGWVCITFLPVFGLHLTSLLTKKTWWVSIGYVAAVMFAIYFVCAGQLFSEVNCPGNFVQYIFVSPILGFLYSLFYAWFLLLALGKLLWYYRRGGPAQSIIGWFIAGYFAFMTPTAFVYILLPAPLDSFPSVFCGFAVLFALVIAAKLLPAYESLQKNKK